MAKKKIILPKIDSKPKYTIELDEDQMYSLGGWLKENVAPLLSTAAGAVMTATGVGAGAGIPMMVGGASSMLGNALADDPETIDYSDEIRMPRTVGKQNMTPNVMSFAKGGNMNEKLMQLEGPKHSEGGIQFLPDAELEGGESVYKDVVNSDEIKITKEIASKYGLPKVAINKTPAEYGDLIENNYKGREVDPFAQTSKEMELNNLAKMSTELAEKLPKSNKKVYGGPTGNNDEFMLSKGYRKGPNGNWVLSPEQMLERSGNYVNPNSNNQYVDPSTPYTDWTDPNYLSPDNILQRNREDYSGKINQSNYGLESRSRLNRYTTDDIPGVKKTTVPNIVGTGSGDGDFAKGQILDIKNPVAINKTGNPFKPFNVPDLNLPDVTPNELQAFKGTVPDKSITDTATKGATTANNLLGLVPLAVGAFQAARTAKEGPDKVKLSRVHADEYNPEFIDPKYQLDQVGDTFATGNEAMNQTSRKDYLRRRIQSATEEAKVKSGVLGQVSAANTQMLNQSRQINNQNRMRADEINLQAGIQEENINAGNKGAWQTARDYQLNNLASMTGEYARDQRLEQASERGHIREIDALSNLYSGLDLQYNPETDSYKYVNSAVDNTILNKDIKMPVNPLSTTNPVNDPYLYNNSARGVNFMPGYNTNYNRVNRDMRYRGNNWLTSGRRYDRNDGSLY